MSVPMQLGVSSAVDGAGSCSTCGSAAGAGNEPELDFRTAWLVLSGDAGLTEALSLFRPVLGLIWILERLVDIAKM